MQINRFTYSLLGSREDGIVVRQVGGLNGRLVSPRWI